MALEKRIQIKVDSKGAESNVNSLDKRMGRLDGTTEKTNESFGKLKGTVIAVAAALQVAKIAKYADAFTSIQNQIRQTTKTTEELTQRTSDLLGVANRSRVDFGATAELYTQLTLSTENLNLTTEEQLRLTETIGKSFAVSGKSAAESAGAIRQLGQAFGSGALRGDEFNSIAEGAPEIMRALQKSLGKTQGELREFAATGGITSEILVNALGSAATVIDDKMNKATKTLAQSFQEAENNATAFVGSSTFIADAMTGAGDAVVYLSENLGVIAANAHRFDGIAKDLSNSLSLLSVEFDGAGDSTDAIVDAFADMPENIRAFIKIATVEILSFFDRVVTESEFFSKKVKAIFTDDTIENVEIRRAAAIERLSQLRRDSISDILLERDSAIDSADKQIQKAKDLRDELKKAPEQIIVTASKSLNTTKTKTKSEEKSENSERSRTEDLRTELQERLEIRRNFNALTLQEFANQFDMERAFIEEDIANNRAALERKRQDDAFDFEQRIVKAGENQALLDEIKAQQALSNQIFEEEQTLMEAEAAQARKDIALDEAEFKAETQQRSAEIIRQVNQSSFSDVLGFMQQFAGKSKTLAKAFVALRAAEGISSVEISTQVASMRALAELGPIAGPPAVAAIQSSGRISQAIIAANAALKIGGGGGGSSGGGGGVSIGGGSNFQQSTPSRQEPIQRSVAVENRGLAEVAEALRDLDPNELLPAEYTQRLVASLDNYERISGDASE